MLDENEKWLLSFYRTSEISGALFFGRLTKMLRPGSVQIDMTKHFADEAQHAWLWTKCIETLGEKPILLHDSYQDQYSSAIGVPANLMEVLAITQVFEKRVVNQYARHSNIESLHPHIRETITAILKDEKWHIEWVKRALQNMESEYGREHIDATIDRFSKADEEVYRKTLQEHEERVIHILGQRKGVSSEH